MENKKLDFEIRLGDKVRSHDFDVKYITKDHECYVEGIIENITEQIEGCNRYKIRTTKRIFDGKETPHFEKYYYPPVNGTYGMLSGEPMYTVQRIQEAI